MLLTDVKQKSIVKRHNITTTMEFTLPPYAFHTYWGTHELSDVDIVKILKQYPAQYIWMSALLYGVDVPVSAIKPSFSGRFDVVIGAKIVAFKKIKTTSRFVSGIVPRLDFNSSQVPSVPKHIISTSDLILLNTKFVPHTSIFEVKDINGFFTWKSCQWFPTGIENNAILCKKVCDGETFFKAKDPKGLGLPLCATPLQVRYQNKLFVLLDEAVIFCGRQYT